MKFGYARVSKNEQSLDVQIKKLEESGCEEIYQEKISGAKDNRSQLNLLLSKLRKGDTICVVRLDRLGRRMSKLIEMIIDFKEKGIEFMSLENNIDTTSPMGMLLFSICAAFAQMERELIAERVKAGLESARKKGRRTRTLLIIHHLQVNHSQPRNSKRTASQPPDHPPRSSKCR